MTRRRVAAVAVCVTVLAAGAVFLAVPFGRGLSFVIRAADLHGPARRIVDLDAIAERERMITIPTARGPLPARLYEPARAPRRLSLLVSGLDSLGIDEPRLRRIARELAQHDVAVVTPDIPELSQFEITPAITDAIEQAALWLASNSGLARDGRIGMMGISFSGGLSIVAAGRASLGARVAYVFALGGHDDLPRVLRYLCTGQEPYPPHQIRLAGDRTASPVDGRPADAYNRPPHDDGVAMVLLGVADRLVPAPQAGPLRVAVRRYLWASALEEGVDRPKAASEFEALRTLTRTMPQPSATLLRYVIDRDVVHLGARLLPYLRYYGTAPSLSVSKSPKPSAPVYLLHGTEDNVIPPIEAEYLADDLRGHVPVRLLLSGLISHAEADRPAHLSETVALASFWGDLLSR